jgi:hypothetical protein
MTSMILPSSFTPQKKFSAGRLIGGEKYPDSIRNNILLLAILGNIFLHKFDQDIGRIWYKQEISRSENKIGSIKNRSSY